MKKLILIIAALTVLAACSKEDVVPPLGPQSTAATAQATPSDDGLPAELKEEDCDDKLKKLEEKKVEEVVLGNNPDAGCSIDEINAPAAGQ